MRPDRGLLPERVLMRAGAVTAVVAGRYLVTYCRRRTVARLESRWRGELHQQVLPALHAAERTLRRGDNDAALEQVRAATRASRTILVVPSTTDDPVTAAIRSARATWSTELHIEEVDLAGMAARVAPAVREALRTIALEALHNAARHQPSAATRVMVRTRGDEVVLSVASSGGGSAAPPGDRAGDPAGGYGAPAMHRAATSVGGRVRTDLHGDTVLVLAELPRRPSLRERVRRQAVLVGS